MGCTSSSSGQQVSKLKVKVDYKPNFGKPLAANVNDYMLKKLDKGLHLKNKIEGQQFIVEDCTGSSIFLLDHIAALTVDSCKDVILVTGPIEGSVFIRDCSNCTIVIACQQLRLRDCVNCQILLFSTTGPIVESSRNIGFGCYSLNYFGIEQHFEKAGLSIWQNDWQSVYDFTPDTDRQHYHSLPYGTDHNTLKIAEGISDIEKEDMIGQGYGSIFGPTTDNSLSQESFIPMTYGLLLEKSLPITAIKSNPQSSSEKKSAKIMTTGLIVVPLEFQKDLLQRISALNSSSPSTSSTEKVIVTRTALLKNLDKKKVELLFYFTVGRSSNNNNSSKAHADFKKLKDLLLSTTKKEGTSYYTCPCIAVQLSLPTHSCIGDLFDLNNRLDLPARTYAFPTLKNPSGIVPGDIYLYCLGEEAGERCKMVFEQSSLF
jgi:hypothetical protein